MAHDGQRVQAAFQADEGRVRQLDLIRRDLELDKEQHHRGTTGRCGVSALAPETRLGVALRFFAGAAAVDIADIFAMSKSCVYHCVWTVVDAVNKRVHIEFPLKDIEKLKSLETEFRAASPKGVWKGCVGCIDGVHFKIHKPSLRDVDDPVKYHVVRKGCYAVLCIAICDARRRFTYYSMTMSATTHDSRAWSSSSLGAKINAGELAQPFFLNGDNAFALSNSMIVPSNMDTDFDFIQSSCRMPIECAFGILIRRVGILWRALWRRTFSASHL